MGYVSCDSICVQMNQESKRINLNTSQLLAENGYLTFLGKALFLMFFLKNSKGQGGLGCCSPRGYKELDRTEQLN